MGLLKNAIHNPRLLKAPSYVSLLCILVGIVWLLVLPLDHYARRTYVSENALLPAQVSTYFGGSEHNVFRAYRHEIAEFQNSGPEEVAQRLGDIFKSQGLKVAHQKYAYDAAGYRIRGENVYAVLQGPRADATEALVLMAAWKNMDNVLNHSGVALALSLARYFKRWSLWSKDIIFVITSDSTAGPQAWVDAYHSTHDTAYVEDLPIKGGALQGAIALDYPAGTGGHRFDKLHLHYDGINGQLPNLDLFNTIVQIATSTFGMACTIQGMLHHDNSYSNRLETVFRGMLRQGLGQASGPHSSFIPYHVDAVTLQTVGDGWHDEMTLGKLVESSFRSLNNLLEHLHQSYFFYLLLHAQRFVSIGTYLPASMLLAVNFSISSIMLWLLSGRKPPAPRPDLNPQTPRTAGKKSEVPEHDGVIEIVPEATTETVERHLFTPLIFLLFAHFLGIIPFYLSNNSNHTNMHVGAVLVTLLSNSGPFAAAYALRLLSPQPFQAATLLCCFSLLILGITLATLSTLNFSLGFIVGILAAPLSFVSVFVFPNGVTESRKNMAEHRSADSRRRQIHSTSPNSNNLAHPKLPCTFFVLVLTLFSPLTVVAGASYYVSNFTHGRTMSSGLAFLLSSQSQAWHIHGTWTSLIIWLVWWPAWFIGMTVGICGLLGFEPEEDAAVQKPVVKRSEGLSPSPSATTLRERESQRRLRKR